MYLFLSTSEQFGLSQLSMMDDRIKKNDNKKVFISSKQYQYPYSVFPQFKHPLFSKFFSNNKKRPYRYSVYEFVQTPLKLQESGKKIKNRYLNLIYNKHPYIINNRKINICSVLSKE
ncbi:Hypothetical protein SRAE_X000077900 [Strongyloides ratti]|uniref:Uncharacterized protein n=1 Tax=Strongyloides ratti TaxID=34506 RepID=A0A090LUY2_STRRB|nr:Hypothetical protein SRAE_X000077900 [Strongyloides ratti]CEF71454.1 Hypothetical protein SRAE_X000077900 [Strongyloides ratti]